MTTSTATIFFPSSSQSTFHSNRSPALASPSILSLATKTYIVHASSNGSNIVDSTPLYDQAIDSVPMPMVLIEQDLDSDATMVQLSFGDRLGALIDTMRALKDLVLDVSKGSVITEGPVKQTKFYITRLDTGRKVEDPDLLERIRVTIINNLLQYHPEFSVQLALGESFGIKAPEKKIDVDIATYICMKEDGPKRRWPLGHQFVAYGGVTDERIPRELALNLLTVVFSREEDILILPMTVDRPGLLVEIIKVLADINIEVESAEIDTEKSSTTFSFLGLVAKDKFYVSYRGAALNSSLPQVVTNCLRYYLRRPETDIDSY